MGTVNLNAASSWFAALLLVSSVQDRYRAKQAALVIARSNATLAIAPTEPAAGPLASSGRRLRNSPPVALKITEFSHSLQERRTGKRHSKTAAVDGNQARADTLAPTAPVRMLTAANDNPAKSSALNALGVVDGNQTSPAAAPVQAGVWTAANDSDTNDSTVSDSTANALFYLDQLPTLQQAVSARATDDPATTSILARMGIVDASDQECMLGAVDELQSGHVTDFLDASSQPVYLLATVRPLLILPPF